MFAAYILSVIFALIIITWCIYMDGVLPKGDIPKALFMIFCPIINIFSIYCGISVLIENYERKI